MRDVALFYLSHVQTYQTESAVFQPCSFPVCIPILDYLQIICLVAVFKHLHIQRYCVDFFPISGPYIIEFRRLNAEYRC